MTLQRLIITFKAEELVLHALNRTQGGPNPGTKARTKEVTELARSGLRDALEALDGGAEAWARTGFTTREDVIWPRPHRRQYSERREPSGRSPYRRADEELKRMIERRSRKGEVDPDEREELWKASVAAYHERQKADRQAAWCEHHQGQVERLKAVLEALVASHEERAAVYRDQPKASRI